LVAAACGDGEGVETTQLVVEGEGVETTQLVVGALHVGAVTDAGYNQAQHDGLVVLREEMGIKLIEAENVAEGPDAERVMENMIAEGATVIFPQSFTYCGEPTLQPPARHGQLSPTPAPETVDGVIRALRAT
jgi:basic membrane lipoprotein Med (substrate-binding protein (PBP1-ABC) superfamily)